MRVRLECTATLSNATTQFPPDTLTDVVVSCSDYHTYAVAPVGSKGDFCVDFVIQDRDGAAEPLRDTLKFHFFMGDPPVLVASGWLPMEQVMPGPSSAQVRCNYTRNAVLLKAAPVDAAESVAAYEAARPLLRRSALRDTLKAAHMVHAIIDLMNKAITSTLDVQPECGAPIFSHVAAAHSMDGQTTVLTRLQGDLALPRGASRLLHHTGLSMLAIADTMQFLTLTFEQVWALQGPDFTRFVAQVCQFCQRSAHVSPYIPDLNVSEKLDAQGQAAVFESECFKRPFFEPFRRGQKNRNGPLFSDDCEGHAEWINSVFQAYIHLYEGPEEDPLCFPEALFARVSAEGRRQLMRIARRIGEEGAKGLITAHLTMVTAKSHALGADGSMGGHACLTFRSMHGYDKGVMPTDIIAEGTNCVQNDARTKRLRLSTPRGTALLPLATIANHISKRLLGRGGPDRRMALHLVQAEHEDLPFYMTAFAQGDSLLAMQEAGAKMRYGVPCGSLSAYSDGKTLMPCTGTLLDTVVGPGSAAWLEAHCRDRAAEMHTPYTTVERVAETVAHWAPTAMYVGTPELEGRAYTNCVVSEAFYTAEEQTAGLAAAEARAAKYNGKHSALGHMRAWAGMDSVYTCISLWTDHTGPLEGVLGHALCHLMEVGHPADALQGIQFEQADKEP